MTQSYLSIGEVAQRIGRPVSTIQGWRSRGNRPFPEPDVQVAGAFGWRPEAIDEWAATQGSRIHADPDRLALAISQARGIAQMLMTPVFRTEGVEDRHLTALQDAAVPIFGILGELEGECRRVLSIDLQAAMKFAGADVDTVGSYRFSAMAVPIELAQISPQILHHQVQTEISKLGQTPDLPLDTPRAREIWVRLIACFAQARHVLEAIPNVSTSTDTVVSD